jgi:hypothetical protein
LIGRSVRGLPRGLKVTAPPNNGMHPTADTQLVKFLQWFVAAGDAGR